VYKRQGLLHLAGFNETIGALTLNAGRVQTLAGTLTLSGDVTASARSLTNSFIAGRLALGSATRTFNVGFGGRVPQLALLATVSGSGGIRKTGLGFMSLARSNTYSGLLTVAEGYLLAENDDAFGATTQGTVVEVGARLGVGPDVHVGAEPLTLQGAGPSGSYPLMTSGTGSNSWAGPIALEADTGALVFGLSCLNLAGPISGPGGFTLTGGGTLILSGAIGNTYGGATHVDTGTLVLDKSVSDGAVPGNLILGDGIGEAGAAVARFERANQIANAGDVAIASSGLFDLNSYYERLDALTGSGPVTLGAGHLIAGHSGSTFSFGGLVSGAGYLWKVGSGTWTLTANNAYLGPTLIETGTLLVNGSQPASDVEIGSAGILGGIGTVGLITSTGGVLSPGVSPGTLTSSNLLFDSSSDFLVELTEAGADQLRVSGKVSLGNASLVVSAPGLLPDEGQQFIIINNDLTDAITGTFAGFAEGALVSAGARQFRITYQGGTGNDVALIATNTAALRPSLTIWHTTTNTVVVAWPLSEIAWLLHATTNLATIPIWWTEMPPPYSTNGGKLQFIEPAPTGSKFYRLHNP